MIPWRQLDSATVPGGGDTLRLMQRGQEFAIMLGRIELMNSRRSGSEVALATLGCRHLAGRAGARVLIGGLGMGFTLRAALALLPADARVTVAELVPAVVAWARGPMADLHGGSLADPRVAIVEGDVGAVIAASAGGFDAILLDVDNGPDDLTRADNDRLYGAAGLAAARAALRPGGVLAVWSAGDDPRFVRRLREAGFTVSQSTARAHGKRGTKHVIWLAARPA